MILQSLLSFPGYPNKNGIKCISRIYKTLYLVKNEKYRLLMIDAWRAEGYNRKRLRRKARPLEKKLCKAVPET